MFEATVPKGSFWKKIVDSMKDLVTEANFEVTPTGISVQAVDSSHVALVSLVLGQSCFTTYNATRESAQLGVNLANFSKLLKVAEDRDTMTLRHTEDSDILTIESLNDAGKRSTEFNLKLMEIEADSMGVPDDGEYAAFVSLPGDLFSKVCRDMAIFGDTLTFEISKEALNFTGNGDLGEGKITVKSSGAAQNAPVPQSILNNNGGAVKTEVKREKSAAVKAEESNNNKDNTTTAVKNEPTDVEESSPTEEAAAVFRSNDREKGEKSDGVYITCGEPLNLTFALRYLSVFSKGAALADRVTLSLSPDSPCRVEFDMGGGALLRWFLAPKVDEDSTQ